MSLGIDIEEVLRFKLDKNNPFIKDNFTKKELEYAYKKINPERTLAGIFCAKESLIKTLKKQAVLLKNIEVEHDNKGRPMIKLLKDKKKSFDVSISHCEKYAIAVVMTK